MQDHVVAVLRKEILINSEKCGVRLSPALEHHLVITTSRYLSEEIGATRITIRMVEAADERAPAPVMRKIGDDCLVCCSLFPEAILKRGGSLSHYAALGRTAYDSAGMTEAAYGFGLMLDVLSVFREDKPVDLLDLARAGSMVARAKTANDVVVPFIGRPSSRF